MIDVEIEADGWSTAALQAGAVARRAAAAALSHAGIEGDVVVLLADDAAVRALHARFRDRDRTTNVLSFPAADSARPHLGDLVLALETCVAEAEAQGKPLADHLAHLVVHGVLHLLGRDHDDEAEGDAMEAEEAAVLAGLGVADPYGGER